MRFGDTFLLLKPNFESAEKPCPTIRRAKSPGLYAQVFKIIPSPLRPELNFYRFLKLQI